MSYQRIDLERLDETTEDLARWADEPLPGGGSASEQEMGCRDRTPRTRGRDERFAYGALYGHRSGTVTPAPIACPIHEEGAAALERPAP